MWGQFLGGFVGPAGAKISASCSSSINILALAPPDPADCAFFSIASLRICSAVAVIRG